MGKFLINLADFYKISYKIVFNQIIVDKDFSMFDFSNVKFFNYSLKNISFQASGAEGYDVRYVNCQIYTWII